MIDWLSLLLRLIGLAGWAERREQARVVKKQAQAVADTPVANKEWTDAAEKGEL